MECRVEYDYIAREDDELTLKKGDIITNVVQKMDGWWEGTLNGKIGMFPDNFVKVIEKPSGRTLTTASSDSQGGTGVKITSKNNVVLRNNSGRNTRRLRALFSYSPEQDDELRLDVGDIIEYVSEVEEGWWRGKLKGKVGIFPSNFVSEFDTLSTNGKQESEPKANDLSKVSVASNKPVPDVIPTPPPPLSEPPPLDDDDDDEPPMLPPKPVREQAKCFYPYQGQNEDELTLTEGDIVTIISKNCEDEGWWRGELKGKIGLFPDNFVKIVSSSIDSSPGHKPATQSSATAPKMSPQERNLVGVKPISASSSLDRTGSGASESKKALSTKKANGTSDATDGVSSSKLKQKDTEELSNSVSSKVEKFTKMNFVPGVKPPTPTSPSGGVSPFSIAANLLSRSESEEGGDFNSVERGEKLSHLTSNRAKPPKRRPPSGIIGKEGEENGINGSFGSHESMEAAPVSHVVSLNVSVTSAASQYNTPSPSTSILETSHTSENGNTDATGGSGTKSKQIPPWMEELKLKQDRKQTNLSSSTSASPPSLPVTVRSTSVEKEPAPTLPVKAPPLPAKPNALASNANTSFEKSPAVNPSTNSSVPSVAPSVASRVTSKKPLAPGVPLASTDGSGGGDSTKHFVSYEEYSKLRDRVIILETELETVRKQVKLLLDREFNQSHMV